MGKLVGVIGLIIFLGVTALVLFTDVATMKYTVRFSNTNLAVNAKNETPVSGSNVAVSSTSQKIENKNVKSEQLNIDFELKELENSNVKTSGKNVDIRGSSGIKKSDIDNLKKGLGSSKIVASGVPSQYGNKGVRGTSATIDKSSLRNIEWNTWKSNFTNRVMDDVVANVPELGKYPNGTMYYYSFNVDYTGRVYNVNVKSLTISGADKEKIANVIRGYSYKEITRFPENSQRRTVSVSSITIFSDDTEYSSPSDFHDFEQIKLKLK